jgi:hypothetical protein
MYKVKEVPGGWVVVLVDSPDAEPILVSKAVQRPEDETHKWEPYSKRQAAYRRCKKLNDAVKDTDAMIARDGAIIR